MESILGSVPVDNKYFTCSAQGGCLFSGRSQTTANGEVKEEQDDMVFCEVCQGWYHLICVKLFEYEERYIEKYHCSQCIDNGANRSLYKPFLNSHRHDFWDATQTDLPVQNGTPAFTTSLKRRGFPCALVNEIVFTFENGERVNSTTFEKVLPRRPVLVRNRRGLGMKLPEVDSLDDIWNFVGATDLDVIDVRLQQTFRMPFSEFVSMYRKPAIARDRVYNVISLEISEIDHLGLRVVVPSVIHEISWVQQHWPPDVELANFKPHVSKFCLMGMQDSFTDFHVDFGGTSVWYHVLKGEKVFYLIKPTPENLRIYEEWYGMTNHTEQFLADKVGSENCYTVSIKEGETVFLPCGWIHAVWTPVDSIVFGGNFLHSFSAADQLDIYDMEKRLQEKLKIPDKFYFPSFDLLHWFVANGLGDFLRDKTQDRRHAKQYVIDAAHVILRRLERWLQKDEELGICKLTDAISYEAVVKQLRKEIANNLKVTPRKLVKRRSSGSKKSSPRRQRNLSDIFTDESDLSCVEDRRHTKLPKIVAPDDIAAIQSDVMTARPDDIINDVTSSLELEADDDGDCTFSTAILDLLPCTSGSTTSAIRLNSLPCLTTASNPTNVNDLSKISCSNSTFPVPNLNTITPAVTYSKPLSSPPIRSVHSKNVDFGSFERAIGGVSISTDGSVRSDSEQVRKLKILPHGDAITKRAKDKVSVEKTTGDDPRSQKKRCRVETGVDASKKLQDPSCLVEDVKSLEPACLTPPPVSKCRPSKSKGKATAKQRLATKLKMTSHYASLKMK